MEKSESIIFVRKNNSKLFFKLKELKATYLQQAEANEKCFLIWKNEEWGLMFRACTVSYAKKQNAKDFGKDVEAFLKAVNNL